MFMKYTIFYFRFAGLRAASNRPRPWGCDRDSECERISAKLSEVMRLKIAEPFASPVDLHLYPSYASVVEYPMDLSTIKNRLDNRFYGQASDVESEVKFIYNNACKFNEPESDIVRLAKDIRDICLTIINRSVDADVQTIHRQLHVRKNTFHDEGADSSGASTSREPTPRITSNNRFRSFDSQHGNSEWKEDCRSSEKRNKVDTSNSKVNC